MGIENRKLSSAVEDLMAHVNWKIGELPRLAREFNLSSEAEDDLRQHLQSELDYLSDLPPETTLKDIMESHFERGAQFREGVLGEKEVQERESPSKTGGF